MNITNSIPVSTTASRTLEVTPDVTVAHFNADMPAVFGTPFMVYIMEMAAAAAIEEYLPDGWLSVGVHVDVRHLAATPIGFTVTATARVTAVDERTVTFSVEAHDGVEQIGTGTHVRAPIERARFDRSMQEKQTQAPAGD